MTDHPARRPPLPSRWPYAACALAAALGGVGAGHGVAALVDPVAAPIPAVAAAIIDQTPAAVKEWAITTFGTADKVALVAAVVIVTAGLVAAAGALARSRRAIGLGALVLLAALAGLAGVTRPASGALAWLPALVTGLVGLFGAQWLWGLLDRRATETPPPSDPLPAHPLPAHPRPIDPTRRRVLVGAAGLSGAGVGGILLGSSFGTATGGPATPALPAVALPTPSATLPAAPTGLEASHPGITPLITAQADLYRIDTAVTLPRIAPKDWSLRIDGHVDRPFTLTWDDLLALPMIEKEITLCCVSNPVGGRYNGTVRWLGTPIAPLLARAGVRSTAEQVMTEDEQGMTISIPLRALTDDRQALLAIGMNGEPLSREHGSPVRIVTPGLYGFIGSTKWVRRLSPVPFEGQVAYWTYRGWATNVPVLTQSRIDTPRDAVTVPASSQVTVGGMAWAMSRGIRAVEVRVDDGPWQTATLGPDIGLDCWRQWFWIWDAAAAGPGAHTLTVRATDGEGVAQTDEETQVIPAGATGQHSIEVSVA